MRTSGQKVPHAQREPPAWVSALLDSVEAEVEQRVVRRRKDCHSAQGSLTNCTASLLSVRPQLLASDPKYMYFVIVSGVRLHV